MGVYERERRETDSLLMPFFFSLEFTTNDSLLSQVSKSSPEGLWAPFQMIKILQSASQDSKLLLHLTIPSPLLTSSIKVKVD